MNVVTQCLKTLSVGMDIKAACATIITVIVSVTGVDPVVYTAIYVSLFLSSILGIIVDIKKGVHPSQQFGQQVIWAAVYPMILVATQQLVRIQPQSEWVYTWTAFFLVGNEVLRVHGYASQLGFTMLEPLTKHIKKYMYNPDLDGRKDKR